MPGTNAPTAYADRLACAARSCNLHVRVQVKLTLVSSSNLEEVAYNSGAKTGQQILNVIVDNSGVFLWTIPNDFVSQTLKIRLEPDPLKLEAVRTDVTLTYSAEFGVAVPSMHPHPHKDPRRHMQPRPSPILRQCDSRSRNSTQQCHSHPDTRLPGAAWLPMLPVF